MDKYIQWLKAHELLIIIALAAFILWDFGGKISSYVEHKLQVDADLKQKELADAKDASQRAANVVATRNAETAKVNQEALRVIATLQAQIAQKDKELAARQKSDAALTDQQLAERWANLTGLVPSDLLPNSGGGLSVSHTAAVVTTQKLEEVPVLVAKVANITEEFNQDEGRIKALDGLVSSMVVQSGADKATLAKQEESCKADIKLAVKKEHDRKAKGNWIIRTAIFVGGVVLGHRI